MQFSNVSLIQGLVTVKRLDTPPIRICTKWQIHLPSFLEKALILKYSQTKVSNKGNLHLLIHESPIFGRIHRNTVS